jgi:hypothetical protein
MTYVCPAWEFETETHLLKLKRVQYRVLRTTGNLPRHTSIRDKHVAFQVPCVYGYITKLWRTQAESIHNLENENVRNIGQGETSHRKYKWLQLGCGHLYNGSSVLDCHGLRYSVCTRIFMLNIWNVNTYICTGKRLKMQTLTIGRPDLSSDRAPHKDTAVIVKL